MPHSVASDLGLHFLLMSHKKDVRLIWVNKQTEPAPLLFTYWPVHEQLIHFALLSNKGSGESAQMCRLTRVFAACIHKIWI